MSARPADSRRIAFTLIELLVVVAIIALLISILLPSLSGAREQAKSVKCLANLRQIGNAMAAYFGDHQEWFPHVHSNQHGITGVYYGGHPGRPGSWFYDDKVHRTTPAGRPFNPYIYPNAPNYDIPVDDPAFEPAREMPIFSCPSDAGGVWNSDGSWDPVPGKPFYWESGTSYDSLYHWVWNWAQVFRANSGGGQGQPGSGKRYLHLSNAFSKIQLRYFASTKVIILEDPFDSAQYLRIPRRGWHKKMNVHNLLFLDSHAAAQSTDTTKGSRGPGWKTCSGSPKWVSGVWWTERFDPDYKYRMIPPLTGD